MADLDPRVLLGSVPLASPAQMEDERQKREIQQQEVELRKQEIMNRRDALIEQAKQRAQQGTVADPVKEKAAFELRVAKAQTLANLLDGADETNYPVVRSIAQHLVGDDANELPEQFDPVRVKALAAAGKQHIAAAKGQLQKIDTVNDAGEPVQMFVTPTEGATYPMKPATPAAGQRPVQVETLDDKGRRVTKFVMPEAGAEYPKPAPAAGGMSAGESAKRSDAKTVAQGIKQFADTGEGLTPETLLSSRTTEQGMALNAELQRMGVDTGKLTREWMAAKGAIRSLNGAQQIRLAQVINKASASLDRLDELNKQWSQNASRWGVKAINHAELRAAQNGLYGAEAAKVATNLESQIADVTSELGQGIMGGNSPTDHALSLAAKNLSADWTQPVLQSAIKQVRYNLNLAQSARNEMLDQLGVQSTQFQTPQADTGGVQVKAPNGKVYTFPNQAQADVFKKRAGIP